MIESFCRLIRFMDERTRYRYKQSSSSIRYVNIFIVFLKVHCLFIYIKYIYFIYMYFYLTRMFIFAISPIIINA
jgi:hypothetical protein